jgi:GNAT superfamily N-acetyltransferase
VNRTQVARPASHSAGHSASRVTGRVTGRAADRAAGHAAEIRPVTAADKTVLRDFFAALSVESRYLRFFAPVTPSCGLLDLMAGKPAHVDAIIAVADGIIVGHAMAADRPAPGGPGNPGRPGGPRATDVGVVVADAWQRRGVGAALMRALIGRARARGVTTLAMDVLPGNRRVLAMIAGHWPEADIGRSADGVDIRIPLPPYQPRPPYAAPPAAGPPAAATRKPAAAAAGKPLAAAVGKPLAVAGR